MGFDGAGCLKWFAGRGDGGREKVVVGVWGQAYDVSVTVEGGGGGGGGALG